MTRKDNVTAAAIIAVFSAAVMARHFVAHGVFSAVTDDTLIYINWTRQFVESFKEGVFYPRWMPDSNGGYGSPTFVFYPPLVNFLTALLNLAIKDIILLVNLLKLIMLFFSGVFMYIFIKDLWGHRAGLAAAAVYVILPYRVFDLYFLGLYASRLTFVWFPLALYLTRRAVTEERLGKNTAMLAVCYSLLCVTHLISAYMFAPVILGFGLLSAGKGRLMRATLRLAAMSTLSLMLSGFYLLPVITERSSVHFEAMQRFWWSDYRNAFLFYLPSSTVRFQEFFYGYLQGVIISSAFFGILFYLYSKNSKENVRDATASFFFVAAAVSLLMMTSISVPVWEVVPGMKLLSFPTRWASVMAFCLSCMVGAGVHHMESARPDSQKPRKGVRLFLLAVVLVITLCYDIDIIRRHYVFTVQDITALPMDLDLPEYVPRDVSFKWLEGELKKPPAAKVVPLSGNTVAVHMERWGAAERVFDVSGAQDAVLRIRTFYYPGWHGSVDGRPVELSSEKTSGAILLSVPAGVHRVALKFSDTPVRVWGKILSALGAAFALFLIVSPGFKRGAHLT